MASGSGDVDVPAGTRPLGQRVGSLGLCPGVRQGVRDGLGRCRGVPGCPGRVVGRAQVRPGRLQQPLQGGPPSRRAWLGKTIAERTSRADQADRALRLRIRGGQDGEPFQSLRYPAFIAQLQPESEALGVEPVMHLGAGFRTVWVWK